MVRRWQRRAERNETGQGENNRGGKEKSENARHVSACRDVCMCPRMCGVCYIKRPITINSGDAVYRGGTRNGINPRGLSADTAIMKRIGLLSVPQVRLSKVQSPMTARENITSCRNRYSSHFDTKRRLRYRFLTFPSRRVSKIFR